MKHRVQTLAASVVVPTQNRRDLLLDTLSSLAAQDFPAEQYEVLVVDDGSDPAVRVPLGVRLVKHDRPRGLNAARNTGAREAYSDLVCFVDDDIEAPTEWLREFVLGADRYPEAWCLGGAIRWRFEGVAPRFCDRCAPVHTEEWQLGLDEPEGATSTYVYGANIGLRRRALIDAGAFDEDRPIYYEEIEWQDRVRRAGGTVVYLPKAWLWHRRTEDDMKLKKRLVKSFRGGRGNAFYHSSKGLPLGLRKGAVPKWLAHAGRHRCENGLFQAAAELGRAVGAVEFAYRSRQSGPSP